LLDCCQGGLLSSHRVNTPLHGARWSGRSKEFWEVPVVFWCPPGTIPRNQVPERNSSGATSTGTIPRNQVPGRKFSPSRPLPPLEHSLRELRGRRRQELASVLMGGGSRARRRVSHGAQGGARSSGRSRLSTAKPVPQEHDPLPDLCALPDLPVKCAPPIDRRRPSSPPLERPGMGTFPRTNETPARPPRETWFLGIVPASLAPQVLLWPCCHCLTVAIEFR
jgi:hypothetical protein